MSPRSYRWIIGSAVVACWMVANIVSQPHSNLQTAQVQAQEQQEQPSRLKSVLNKLKIPTGKKSSKDAPVKDSAVKPASATVPTTSPAAAVANTAPPADHADPYPMPAGLKNVELLKQSKEEAFAKSEGCLACHKDAHDPHKQPGKPMSFALGCTDCHGGDPKGRNKAEAHVHPLFGGVFHSSANPVRSYTVLNHERPEFIRFMNPGDLRVAHISCGTSGCHSTEVLQVRKSMMTHGCMLWGAALYNNGSVVEKWPRYGEAYSMHGAPLRLQNVPTPTKEETSKKGVLPYLDPLPRFQVTQPGNILRIFERGGRFAPDVGIPERLEEPGRPRQRLSNRGLGTQTRTDPVFIGLQKTRLLDPTLNFLGTNDHAGDYRSSGCTACHVVYANDRSPIHSGPYAKYGNRGFAAAEPDDLVKHVDPTIPKTESGHPIEHRFTRAIPSSQCIVCHVHPGTTVMNSYLGYMWWDMETDGEMLYPKEQKDPTAEEFVQSEMSDPHSASAKGLWSDPEFLAEVWQLNKFFEHTYLADFHGHGWLFSAVFKKNRQGHHVDHKGELIEHVTPELRQKAMEIPLYVKALEKKRDELSLEQILKAERKLESMRDGLPVHMLDIHLEKGMHCVDCHYVQDMHGNTKLYGEVRAAIEIRCEDCHGTVDKPAPEMIGGRMQMRTGGPAATERPPEFPQGRELTAMRTPFGQPRFEMQGKKIIQHSMVEKGLSWEVSQVVDTVDPESSEYNANAALAKTVRMSDQGEWKWGDLPENPEDCAHANKKMSCIACHSSWNPTCYGCHLPQKATKKMPELHNEGDVSRNYTAYNFQTLRDDVFMLAKDGNVTGNRIGPSRSSCAIHVSSYNINRELIYTQQQTISGGGFSGIAFSTNVPHTVRGRGETKMCADCHISDANDNNAVMAQLLMHGTNYLNFIGRFAWVAGGDHGLFAVGVTERAEPQAVFGSTLHEAAYPEHYEHFVEEGREIHEDHEHPGKDIGDNVFHPFMKHEVKTIQTRGEYAYCACGEAGVRIFDIAFIEHKGFSERITTAPFSPWGQKFFVRTKYATCVTAPTTIAPDPTRTPIPENEEQAVHAMYAYIYATDLYEGLIMIGAGTLLDGDPTNNFVKKDVVFNPGGCLNGAKSVTIFSHYAYVSCDAGLVVVDIDDPTKPKVVAKLGKGFIKGATSVKFQFRYGFVCDKEGIKVIDVTNPGAPEPVTALKMKDVHNIYVARNYAYVAAGHQGLVILDVTNPAAPFIDQIYNAGGKINDLHDVKLGVTYASQFAYLADGHNGMHVLQLTSPETPGSGGFLARPYPKFIATFHIPKGGSAYYISKGVDRDRAVDEAGNQIAVFGRVGGRPMNLEEQRRLYINRDGYSLFRVKDFNPDYEIKDPIQREIMLQHAIEGFYGPSRNPKRIPGASSATLPGRIQVK